eukprot:6499410-Pyramimonas_sp.AAC.1
MAKLMADSSHEMQPVEAGNRFQCVKCLSVVSISSHGAKPSQEFLRTPCVPAEPWSGPVHGVKSVRGAFLGASFLHPSHEMV